MPVWTEQQNNAINASNWNIIVSAAAGSGKTAVLVERVVRIITNKERPVDIDKLLIVTFTRPAAAEMKSRISQRLQKILSENPTDKCALKQLSLLPCAKVCTIDSFCLDLVKENFFELGINRDFNVLDEAEAQIIADNALNNVLDACFEESNKNFIALTEMLSSPKDDKNLISSLKRVYSYIYSQPFPFEWLDNAASAYNPDTKLEKSVWISSVNDFVTDGLNCGINLINECISLLDVNDEAYDKYFDALNSDLSVYRSLMKSLSDGWDASKSAFENISFCTLRGKKGHTPPYKEEIALRRNVYKDIVKKLSDFFCESEKEFYEDNTKIYPVIKELCKVIKLFDDEYRKLKDERNAYTFSDIEHFAISLLINKDESGQTQKSRLALDLESSFYEILVDEYQDTNEAQDTLFSVLSNGKNRFMVGDVKQSIYRFRLAMPFIFNEKKEKFINYSKDKYNLNSKIILDKNFRSRQGICDYVNFLFSAVMSEKTGELNYNENEYLNYGADYPKTTVPSVSFKILDCTKSADADKSEAIFIARTVLDKINSNEQVYDAKLKKNRRLQYGDFAILLRSVKNHISVYNEVLSSFGIPVICDNSTNLFENNEIKILISFLRVIDNPMQDIPLLALMMSPLYGFSADELTEIKLENGNKNVSLCTSVINSKSKKVANFLDELEAFRKIAITMSVSSFIRFICLYKNLYAFANALGNGEQRCKNINKFISFAENFDSSQSIGLTSFMRLVNKTAQSDKGIESAAVNSSSENAVSVMSVHHSKGLEFPVVILAGTERKYNYDDLKQKIQLHPKFGIGVK
ncbi:MAG: UvrD-helicase domain-containing protein, partial [Clostridiales bacterium]|nr:UvrD-helicase domain-containing protein [Clostridiales bacterium]